MLQHYTGWQIYKESFMCGQIEAAQNQGRNEVRWRPGQEASLAPPCSNLRSFGSKCIVLKKVLATLLGLFGGLHSHSAAQNDSRYAPAQLRGNYAPLVTPLHRNTPVYAHV